MSNTATIKVQYKDEPKSPTGPGSIKGYDGQAYKVWPRSKGGGAILSQFEKDNTYTIEYDEEEYQGKTKRVARKILSTSESSNGSSEYDRMTQLRVPSDSNRSARIERQAALKVAVQFHSIEVQAGKAEPLSR